MRFEILSNRHIYIILCFNMLLCEAAFSQQADAGPDKLNCNGEGVKIGGVGDPGWCYSWKPDTGLDDPNILNPIANPTVKTTYTLTVTGPDFSFKSTDDVEVDVLELKDIEYKQSNEGIFGKEGSGSVCIGSTYEFKVNTTPAGGSPSVAWDLYDLDFFNQEITKGTGSTFNRTFNTDLEKGTTQARFFCDSDADNTFDDDEANVTLEFEVKDKTVHSISVSAAATVGAPNAAGLLSAGTTLLDTRQAADDYRCCATLSLSGGVGSYAVSATKPDVIASSADMDNLISNVPVTIRVVNTITWCGGPATPGFVIAGCARTGSENTAIVASGRSATVWTHELGHTFGLGHRDSNAANLMHSVAGAGTILNENESDAFE